MRLTLNYNVYTVISACTHPCDTKTFTHNITIIHLLQLKMNNIWMKFSWKQKVIHLGINQLSVSNLCYFK